MPARLGYEASGSVEAVGEGVDKAWIGKRAATIPGFSMNKYGVLGEQALAPAAILGEYPDNISPVEAAAIWMQYLTAYTGLVHLAHTGAGDFVIIPAASSSVGLAAIQIVRSEGGKSIAATRTPAKRDELLALGADHVIVTEEEDLVAKVKEITNDKGARIIFDPVGGPFIEKLAQAAQPRGILLEYGALAMQPTPFPRIAIGKSLTVRGYTLMELHQDPPILDAAKKYIFDRLQDRTFVPKIAKTFPLTEIREAFEYLESNAQIGKVVVTV